MSFRFQKKDPLRLRRWIFDDSMWREAFFLWLAGLALPLIFGSKWDPGKSSNQRSRNPVGGIAPNMRTTFPSHFRSHGPMANAQKTRGRRELNSGRNVQKYVVVLLGNGELLRVWIRADQYTSSGRSRAGSRSQGDRQRRSFLVFLWDRKATGPRMVGVDIIVCFGGFFI